jgi:membrane dipeptidase
MRLPTRVFLIILILVLLAAAGVVAALPRYTDASMNRVRLRQVPVSQSALALHHKLLVADLHADSLLFGRNLLRRSTVGHVDLPRLEDGNVALQMFTIVTKVPRKLNFVRNADDTDQITELAVASGWSPSTYRSLKARALYQSGRLKEFSDRSDGRIVIIRSRSNLRSLKEHRAAGEQVTGAMLGIEGAQALEGNVNNVDVLYDAGIRMVGLAHFYDNEFAGSAHGVNKGGLTPLGRELVKKLESRRVLIDLAHASPATIDDVLKMATRPVMVSHTGVRGTCDNQRNLSDDQLRRIAHTGGVIGIAYFSTAICGEDVRAIVRAIGHAIAVAGVDHVALGSDFDGGVTVPFDTSHLARITEGLKNSGLSDGDIAKVMGGNVFRFFAETLPD